MIKDNGSFKQAIETIIRFIGEDPERMGLKGTPERMIRSFEELFSGYDEDPKEILQSNFIESGYNEMILLKDIEFVSTCEHHLQTITGIAHVAYIPDEHIVGISKLARLVDIFARRLQMQERMTVQIANTLQEVINPTGVGVVIEARHGCVSCRGVRKQNAKMVTSKLLGVFKEDPATRDEFLRCINA